MPGTVNPGRGPPYARKFSSRKQIGTSDRAVSGVDGGAAHAIGYAWTVGGWGGLCGTHRVPPQARRETGPLLSMFVVIVLYLVAAGVIAVFVLPVAIQLLVLRQGDGMPVDIRLDVGLMAGLAGLRASGPEGGWTLRLLLAGHPLASFGQLRPQCPRLLSFLFRQESSTVEKPVSINYLHLQPR